MLAVYFFSYFQRSAIPGTIFNEIQSDFRLTAVAVTAMGALFTYVYGGLQLVAGMAVDRFGGVRVMLVGGGIMTLGALLFPLTHHVSMLYASRVLTAVGASCLYLSIVKEIYLRFAPNQFTLLLGGALCVGYSGGVMGMLPFERAVAVCGWRPALLGVALLTALVLGCAWIGVRRLPPFQPAMRSFSLGPLREILRNRTCRPLLVSGAINFPVYFVIQTILGKKLLQDVVGLDSAAAASFTMLMYIVSALANLLGGWLPRWLQHRRKPFLIAAGLLLLAATALLTVGAISRAPGWLFLMAYLLLACAMFASPVSIATIKELNRPEAVAQSVALMNALGYIGAGLIGHLAGLVLDHFRGGARVVATGTLYPAAAYATLFALLTVLSALSLLATLRVPETGGRASVPHAG